MKIARAIARLHVGGPALHVAYLTEGLAGCGYDPTLVAGSLAWGEESMAYVAQARGVVVEPLDALHGDSPLAEVRAMLHLAS